MRIWGDGPVGRTTPANNGLMTFSRSKRYAHIVRTPLGSAARQLSALHALILQDAFRHAAARAGVLLTTQKNRETKRERQTVLKELVAFTEPGLGETPPASGRPQVALDGYPSPLAEWQHEFTALPSN